MTFLSDKEHYLYINKKTSYFKSYRCLQDEIIRSPSMQEDQIYCMILLIRLHTLLGFRNPKNPHLVTAFPQALQEKERAAHDVLVFRNNDFPSLKG